MNQATGAVAVLGAAALALPFGDGGDGYGSAALALATAALSWRAWPAPAWPAALVVALAGPGRLLGVAPSLALAAALAALAVLTTTRWAAAGAGLAGGAAATWASASPWVLLAVAAGAVAVWPLAEARPLTPRAAESLGRATTLAASAGLVAAVLLAPTMVPVGQEGPDAGLALGGLVLLTAAQGPAWLVARRAQDRRRALWPLVALGLGAAAVATVAVERIPTDAPLGAFVVVAAVQAPVVCRLASRHAPGRAAWAVAGAVAGLLGWSLRGLRLL